MSGLSDMQAKRLAEKLATQVAAGHTDTSEFQQGLRQYHTYQDEQRAAGKKTREGKHSAKLAPLLAALPAEQRALGLHVSAEHDATRRAVAEDFATQLAPLKQGRYIQLEGTSSKQLQATILELQHAKRKKAAEARAEREAAQGSCAKRRTSTPSPRRP